MNSPGTVSNFSISTRFLIRSGILIVLILYSLHAAYKIRLHAITTFGTVIHEFDPYFNFRATEVRTLYYFTIYTNCLFSFQIFRYSLHI